MSFDTIAFVVTADPLGSIETSVGVPLTTALTSDPDKGCPTILSTTGVSAARCLVPFVTTDGEICFGVAPAPKKEAAYVSSGLVTASGAATVVLRRCEVFSSTATVQATSGTASYVRKVSFSSTPATRTTSGSVGYTYQRCEIFSSTATVQATSGSVGYTYQRCEIFSSTPTVQATSGSVGYTYQRCEIFSAIATVQATSGSVGYTYQRCEIFSSTPTVRPASGGAGCVCGIKQHAVPEIAQTSGDTGTTISLHFSSGAAVQYTSGESGQCFSVIYDAPTVPLDATGTVGAVVSALFAASIDVGGLSSVTSVDDVIVTDAYQSNFSVNVSSGDDYVVQDAFGFVLVPVITSDGELSWATCRSGCASTGGAVSNEQITYIESVTFVFSGSGLVTTSGEATAVLRQCEVFSSTATVQTTSGDVSCIRAVSFLSTATARTTSGSVGYTYQRCEVFSSTPTVCTTSGGAGCICGIVQRAVPENTQTFGDTGTVISLHFSSNAAARSTSGTSTQCSSVVYDAPIVSLNATGTVGAVISASFAASIGINTLSPVMGVNDVIVTDAYQSNFSVNVGSGDDYVVQDAFSFVLVPIITSDGELSWTTCRSGCANTGGAASNEQITYIEPVTFVFSGSGLVTASGTASIGIDCRGIGGVVASGSVLISTRDSLRSLGIAEVSGAAQVIVSSVKNGSGTWHSYGSAGLSYNALFSLINSHKERRVFVERDSRKCEIARGNFGAVLDREPRGDVCPQAPARIKIAPNYQRGDVFPGPLRMVHRDESIRGGIVKLLEVA